MTGLPVFLPDCRVAPAVGPIGVVPFAFLPDGPAVPAVLSITAKPAPGVKLLADGSGFDDPLGRAPLGQWNLVLRRARVLDGRGAGRARRSLRRTTRPPG
jgi:hypothetical protein